MNFIKNILTLLTAILFSLPAHAENVKCYDVLGVAMYCKEFLAAPKLPAFSTLMSTFGDPLPCAEKRIALGGITNVQIDLIDATCWRNNKCPPGAAKPTDLRAITKRAQRVNALAVKYPSIKFDLSPGLEHDVRNEGTVRAMCKAAIEGCPTCKCVNSPFTGAKPAGIPIERHGNSPEVSYSTSNDGASLFDSNSPVYQTIATDMSCGWFNELNLRFSGEKTFTPPLKRTCKPTKALFEQAYLVMQPEPAPPAFPAVCTGNKRDVASSEILKTNAESYCDGEARGNKPMFITKVNTSKFSIISPRGNEIGCFKKYGPFSGIPGSLRYYVGNCSGETPVQLYKEAGGEWAFMKNGPNCIRFNTIRRKGSFR